MPVAGAAVLQGRAPVKLVTPCMSQERRQTVSSSPVCRTKSVAARLNWDASGESGHLVEAAAAALKSWDHADLVQLIRCEPFAEPRKRPSR